MEFLTGVIVSLVIQGLKKWWGLDKFGTYIALAVLSLAGAYAYIWLASAGYWESVVQTLIVAGAVHNFVLRRFEE